MTDARWERVGSLFGELVTLDGEQRAQRLQGLAATDAELGAELESLLAADSEADDVLAPLDRLASDLSFSPVTPSPAGGAEPIDPYGFVGETIDHYRIEAPLGGGGMGVVYQAEDLRLRRTVALKFLPPVWNLDPRFRERFLREARAAAALDHPNVCSVYEIGETDEGQLFIAMAFYEGQTLRRQLAEGPLPIRQALGIAIQVARGLAAAHAAGIHHRDIKPGNLIVTPDGTVKILDFGLATRHDAPSEDAPAMGTVAYMSPEQVRDESAGAPADLWALGVLLHETITGRRPFHGASKEALFDAILHTDPAPPGELRPETPPGLAALTLRLLAKDPAGRPEGVEAVLDALLIEADRIDPRATSVLSSLRDVVRRRPWTVAAGTAAVAAVVLLAVVAAPAVFPGSSTFLPGRPPVDGMPKFSLEGASPVVADAGTQVNPALSPDGSTIAFVQMKEPDEAHVYVRPVEGGQPRLLTGGLPGTHWAPRWSPDGERLAFTSWTAEGLTPGGSWAGRVAIYIAEVAGGDRDLLLTTPTGPDPITVAWSPDGRRLAYTVADTIAIVDVASGRRLQAFHIAIRPQTMAPHGLDWSPDGSRIAFSCCNPHYWLHAGDFAATAPNNLFVLELTGEIGRVRRLTDEVTINASPRWLPDSRHLLFVSNRTGTKDVFVVDATGEAGELRQVTSGVNSHTIDLGPDGELFYSVVNVNGNVWSVPLGLDRVATTPDMEPVTTGRNDIVEFFDISDDGRYIAFDSSRDGNQNIWVGAIGAPARRVTEHPSDDWDPGFSPDGSRLTFYSVRNGNRDVFVMNTDGSGLVQVTSDPANDWWPNWISDSVLLFTSTRSGEGELYESRENPDGTWGAPRRITHDGGGWPIVSPDRTKVLYLRPPAPPGDRRFILDLGRGASAPARELSYTMAAWSRDSRRHFSVVRDPDGSWLISSRSPQGGDPTPVLRLEIGDHQLQAGVDRLFFQRREFESDIWRMRLVP